MDFMTVKFRNNFGGFDWTQNNKKHIQSGSTASQEKKIVNI